MYIPPKHTNIVSTIHISGHSKNSRPPMKEASNKLQRTYITAISDENYRRNGKSGLEVRGVIQIIAKIKRKERRSE
jgi:hypothetical protein